MSEKVTLAKGNGAKVGIADAPAIQRAGLVQASGEIENKFLNKRYV